MVLGCGVSSSSGSICKAQGDVDFTANGTDLGVRTRMGLGNAWKGGKTPPVWERDNWGGAL